MKKTKIDIHVHTTASSCSNFSPQALVSMAVGLKLPVVIITNHHDSRGDTEYLEKELEKHGILFFAGMEITNQWGDFLLFGRDLHQFSDTDGIFPADKLPQPDIAVIWAHPYRFMGEKEIESIKWEVNKYIDGVEGINGNCMLNCKWANTSAINLARQLGKPVTAASDAHSARMYMMAWTEFNAKIENYSDFIEAIKKGKFIPGSQG